MKLNHLQYNETFLANPRSEVSAEEQKYELKVTGINVNAGEKYWKIIGIHHLTSDEGEGAHHLYLDVLDGEGNRIQGAKVASQTGDQPEILVTIDKPANEPGTNVPIWKNDNLRAAVQWPPNNPLPSEQISNIHTLHPDEGPGSTVGHHAFYVVFQEVTNGEADITTPTTTVETTTTTTQTTESTSVEQTVPAVEAATVEEAITLAGQPLIIPLNLDAMFYKVAQEKGLGERLTAEYTVTYQGQDYAAQIYEKGIVYAAVGDWGNVKMIERKN